MNTITEHDRNLAEKLKSLSLEPLAFEFQPPDRGARRQTTRMAALVLAATVSCLVFALYRADIVERIETILFQKTGTADAPGALTAEIAASGSGAAVNRTALVQTDMVAGQNAAPPGRDVAGAGYVVAPVYTNVFSKYEGEIAKVAVDAGDRVAAGQVLVTLDDAGARFALEGAEIAKGSAELVLAAKDIALAQARTSLTRAQILVARNAASKQVLEEAETASQNTMNSVAQARNDVIKADLDIRKAREWLSELTVLAPIAGTVTRLDARAGDSVLARADSVREDDSLLTIIDTADMVIDADVAEANIALMQPGLRGEAVLDGFPDRPFSVEISRIAPVISMEKGTVTLRLSLFSPPAGIRPNMAARIRISASAATIATNQQGAKN